MLTTKCGSLEARHTEEHVQLTDTVFYQINCLVVHGSVNAKSAATRTVFSSTLTCCQWTTDHRVSMWLRVSVATQHSSVLPRGTSGECKSNCFFSVNCAVLGRQEPMSRAFPPSYSGHVFRSPGYLKTAKPNRE